VESAGETLRPLPAAQARGKTANVVNVAIAREMVGFIWSIACTIQSAPKAA
jgi:transposase